MGKVLDIRGTHGSGKSYIPHHILTNHSTIKDLGEPLTYDGRDDTILGYTVPDLNLYILGRYETACGGCDGIKTQVEIKARIERVIRTTPTLTILIEGILVSHTFGPWDIYAKGKDWNFLFLDTPLDVCIARVNSRREASGKGPLQDPRNIVKDWHRIRSLQPKFLEAGHKSTWLDHTNSIQSVMECL